MGNKAKILVVDTSDADLKLIEAMLKTLDYNVIVSKDEKKVINIVEKNSPDLILIDISMPKINGIEIARKVKSNEILKGIPIIIISAIKDVKNIVKAMEAGADEFLSKPIELLELRARVKSLLKVKLYNDYIRNYHKTLEKEVLVKTEQLSNALEKLKDASLEIVFRLSRASEYKDDNTGLHIKRVGHYSYIVAKELGLSKEEIENIYYASPMHDIGKIGIPDRILLKPAKLSDEEWQIMKQHTLIGAKILEGSNIPFLNIAEGIALNHHEKWDGTGYPKGLKGEEIPLNARIVAIADVFDALVSKRPYKEPFTIEQSFSIIEEGKGTHFDPDVVETFLSKKEEIMIIYEKYKDVKYSLLYEKNNILNFDT